jgi:hypothetical protein
MHNIAEFECFSRGDFSWIRFGLSQNRLESSQTEVQKSKEEVKKLKELLKEIEREKIAVRLSDFCVRFFVRFFLSILLVSQEKENERRAKLNSNSKRGQQTMVLSDIFKSFHSFDPFSNSGFGLYFDCLHRLIVSSIWICKKPNESRS